MDSAFVESCTQSGTLRQGNGRTQRAFFGQSATEASWVIDWSDLGPDENVQASILALRGDNGPLRALLDGLVGG